MSNGIFTRKRLIENLEAMAGIAASVLTVASIFYVDSVTGQSGYNGTNPSKAKAKITQAVALCTNAKNNLIICSSDHSETLTASETLDLSKSGITVVGTGKGNKRTTLNFGTDTTATLTISADGVGVKNIRFVNAIDSLVAFVTDGGENTVFEDCDFIGASTLEFLCGIAKTTTKDGLTLRRCKFLQPTDPAGSNGAASTGCIYVVDTENILVEDCIFDGFFETACLHNKTTACKYLTWRRNSVNQQLSDAARILTPVGVVGASYGPDADFIPGRGYPARRATAAPPAQGVSTAYFNVNGTVDITSFQGECTTAFATGGGASTLSFEANPTATGSNVAMCAGLDVNTIVVNTLFGITGTLATALQNGHGLIAMTTPFRMTYGTIEAKMVTTTLASGSAKWSLTWMPTDYSLGVPNVIAV